jgi:hypothetical protein
MELEPPNSRLKRPPDSDEVEPENRRSPRPRTEPRPEQSLSSTPSDASSPLDSRMQLEYAIEEDIPAELEDFVRLARLGQFMDAEELFQETLKDHVHLFPVAAEYADCLMEQGSYGKLSKIVDHCITRNYMAAWTEDERDLFHLLRDFAHFKSDGDLAALRKGASEWYNKMSKTSKTPSDYSEAEIQALEIYLHSTVLAYCGSNWVRAEETHPPGFAAGSLKPWEGFQEWTQQLSQNQRPWECQRILRLLLHVLEPNSAASCFDNFVQSIPDHETGGPWIVARIAGSNAYVAYLLNTYEKYSDDLKAKIRKRTLQSAYQLHQQTRDLLKTYLETAADYKHGRLYSEWSLNSSRMRSISPSTDEDALFLQLKDVARDCVHLSDLLVRRDALRMIVADFRQNREEKQTQLGYNPWNEMQLCCEAMEDAIGFADFLYENPDNYKALQRNLLSRSSRLLSLTRDIVEAVSRWTRLTVPTLNAREAEVQLQLASGEKWEDEARKLLREAKLHLPARTFQHAERSLESAWNKRIRSPDATEKLSSKSSVPSNLGLKTVFEPLGAEVE